MRVSTPFAGGEGAGTPWLTIHHNGGLGSQPYGQLWLNPKVKNLCGSGGSRLRVPVTVPFRVLKIAKQPFYRWFKEPVSARDSDDTQVTNAAIDVHHDDPVFG